MGALLNYLKKQGLVHSDTVDEEQACHELSESINEMMLAMSRHHAGLSSGSRELKAELGRVPDRADNALLVQAETDYPALSAAERYLIVESQNPALFEGASIMSD
jgi:hypothetical protein